MVKLKSLECTNSNWDLFKDASKQGMISEDQAEASDPIISQILQAFHIKGIERMETQV